MMALQPFNMTRATWLLFTRMEGSSGVAAAVICGGAAGRGGG